MVDGCAEGRCTGLTEDLCSRSSAGREMPRVKIEGRMGIFTEDDTEGSWAGREGGEVRLKKLEGSCLFFFSLGFPVFSAAAVRSDNTPSVSLVEEPRVGYSLDQSQESCLCLDPGAMPSWGNIYSRIGFSIPMSGSCIHQTPPQGG